MKKFFSWLLVICLLLGVSGCGKVEETDALKFKKEYESLNGTKSSSGKVIRSVSIEEDNPMIYSSASEIVEKIENKDSFIVYFGFASCPWCRSMIEVLLKSAKDNGVDTIYYVDIFDIRDTITVTEDGELERKDGTKDYMKLLELLGDVLSDYSLTDKNGNSVDTNEKRIYAPNVVAVVDGKAIKMAEGIADGLEDPYSELTDEMKEDSYNKLKCIFECMTKEETICQKNAC